MSLPICVGQNRPVVRILQATLEALGFDTGGLDSVFGRRTRRAVIGLQKMLLVDDSGDYNAETHRALLARVGPLVVQDLHNELLRHHPKIADGIVSEGKNVSCPEHGVIPAGHTVHIGYWMKPGEIGPSGRKVYCLMCFMQALDEIGVNQVTELGAAPKGVALRRRVRMRKGKP